MEMIQRQAQLDRDDARLTIDLVISRPLHREDREWEVWGGKLLSVCLSVDEMLRYTCAVFRDGSRAI